MDFGQYEYFTEDEFTEDEQDAKVEFDGGYGMQGFSPKDIALKVKAEQEVARVMANSGVFAMEDEEDQNRIKTMQSQITSYFNYMEEGLVLSNAGDGDSAYQLLLTEMAPISNAFFDTLLTMNSELQEDLANTMTQVEGKRNSAQVQGAAIISLYFVVIIIALVFTNLTIIAPLKRANKELKDRFIDDTYFYPLSLTLITLICKFTD